MDIHTDWTTSNVIDKRERYYAASQRKFQPYEKPLIIKRGSGQYLWDEHDNRYIDLLAMNVCVSVGHSHPEVNQAASDQASALSHCTTMYYHPVPAHYCEELAATMPPQYEWVVHLTNSGAEAVDLALMMARTYTGNKDIVALQGSYHGPTYGAQSVTGISGFRHDVALPGNVQFALTPHPYRGAFADDVEMYLDSLDGTIQFSTSARLAGMIIEPIQGYGGAIPIPARYIEGAAQRIRSAGGLLIIDEVQAGVGRTGKSFWSFDCLGVVPDIVVAAKGIGNGYPLAAVIARREFAEAMADKFLFHTYGSNPVSCAAGRAVLRIIERDRLQDNADKVGKLLLEGLKSVQRDYPVIGDVRGTGLLMAVELVKDPATKEPASDETAAVFENTRKYGLVTSKAAPHRNVLRLVPPMCLSEKDVPVIVDAMARSFHDLN
ncbi:MAG: aspartate aminotransferase family protein [Acidiferrobacterales bacterium]|nr:aspartate aminotransferase family protein [Acidiferrobacterales bacterium]